MIDIATITQQWEIDQPKLNDLGQEVVAYLRKELFNKELHPEISYRTKEIQSLIKKIIKKQRDKAYGYNDLKDKLGIRVICPFISDLEIVDSILKSSFIIRKEEKKKNAIDFNKLDYQSNHYDVSVIKGMFNFDEEFVFEIQVRTMNQHAWANSAHILYYKQDIALPDEMKHRIYRLLSLYELADEEFEKVNDYLKSRKDDLSYSLLRSLEGKLYKYAQSDYDREWSMENINSIMGYFSKNQREEIIIHIENFILEHEAKIQHIFDDNKHRYANLPLLTQPEIFVLWYGLEKYEFSITDNWDDISSENELETIKNLWCND